MNTHTFKWWKLINWAKTQTLHARSSQGAPNDAWWSLFKWAMRGMYACLPIYDCFQPNDRFSFKVRPISGKWNDKKRKRFHTDTKRNENSTNFMSTINTMRGFEHANWTVFFCLTIQMINLNSKITAKQNACLNDNERFADDIDLEEC